MNIRQILVEGSEEKFTPTMVAEIYAVAARMNLSVVVKEYKTGTDIP